MEVLASDHSQQPPLGLIAPEVDPRGDLGPKLRLGHVGLVPAIRRDHPLISQRRLVDDRQGAVDFFIPQRPNLGIGCLVSARMAGPVRTVQMAGMAGTARTVGPAGMVEYNHHPAAGGRIWGRRRIAPSRVAGSRGRRFPARHSRPAPGLNPLQALRRRRVRSRLRGILKGVLILILAGHLRGGLAHLGHELSQQSRRTPAAFQGQRG